MTCAEESLFDLVERDRLTARLGRAFLAPGPGLLRSGRGTLGRRPLRAGARRGIAGGRVADRCMAGGRVASRCMTAAGSIVHACVVGGRMLGGCMADGGMRCR